MEATASVSRSHEVLLPVDEVKLEKDAIGNIGRRALEQQQSAQNSELHSKLVQVLQSAETLSSSEEKVSRYQLESKYVLIVYENKLSVGVYNRETKKHENFQIEGQLWGHHKIDMALLQGDRLLLIGNSTLYIKEIETNKVLYQYPVSKDTNLCFKFVSDDVVFFYESSVILCLKDKEPLIFKDKDDDKVSFIFFCNPILYTIYNNERLVRRDINTGLISQVIFDKEIIALFSTHTHLLVLQKESYCFRILNPDSLEEICEWSPNFQVIYGFLEENVWWAADRTQVAIYKAAQNEPFLKKKFEIDTITDIAHDNGILVVALHENKDSGRVCFFNAETGTELHTLHLGKPPIPNTLKFTLGGVEEGHLSVALEDGNFYTWPKL